MNLLRQIILNPDGHYSTKRFLLLVLAFFQMVLAVLFVFYPVDLQLMLTIYGGVSTSFGTLLYAIARDNKKFYEKRKSNSTGSAAETDV